jgi:hypothetical protein
VADAVADGVASEAVKTLLLQWMIKELPRQDNASTVDPVDLT